MGKGGEKVNVLRNTSSYVYLFHSWTIIHKIWTQYAHKDINVYVKECVDLFE